MAGETTLTVVGNLTADPELKFTQSGAAVASFTVASTPRVMRDGQWQDGDALFIRCNAWRQMAENVAEGLRRGHRVVVTGRLRQRSFETREGEKRTVMELEVDDIGASLKFAQVAVRRPARQDQAGGSSGAEDPWGEQYPAQGQSRQRPQTPAWGSQGRAAQQAREAVQTGGMGYGFQQQTRGGFADEPPFLMPRVFEEYNG